MRYINFEKAISSYSNGSPLDFAEFSCIVEHLATVESIEIIRCKECKYLSTLRGKLSCTFHGGRGTYPDSYCSDGQTKEKQQDTLELFEEKHMKTSAVYSSYLTVVITHKDGKEEYDRKVLIDKTSQLKCIQAVYEDLSRKIKAMSEQCIDFADNPYHKYFEVFDGEKNTLYKYEVCGTS